MVLRTIPTTRSCAHNKERALPAHEMESRTHRVRKLITHRARKWTVFESNELLRCFKPPLLRVSLLSGSPQRDSNPYLHLEGVATYSS